jgi:hypothetical protein
MRATRKILIALAVGSIMGLAPMFAEQAEARIGGGGRVGVGRVGIGAGVGRAGVGRAGVGRVGVGRVGVGRVGWAGRGWGVRPGVARAAWWGGRPGLARTAWWGGAPGWRFRRAGWGWGAPLAVGLGIGAYYGSSCYQWDPYYGAWVSVCSSPYYGGYW